jgi:hypothetical protein
VASLRVSAIKIDCIRQISWCRDSVWNGVDICRLSGHSLLNFSVSYFSLPALILYDSCAAVATASGYNGIQKKNDVITWRQATQAESNAQAAWAAAHPGVEPNEKRQRKARDVAVKKRAFKQWQQRWNNSSHHITTAMPRRWNASTLLNANETQDREAFGCVPAILHRGLTRAQSSIATQLRTEHIGLRTYLHRRYVPGVESPACPCGFQSQNVKHMLTRCDQWSYNRGLWLQRAADSQFTRLLHESDNVSRITRWIINEGVLRQFRLAKPVEDLVSLRAAARSKSYAVAE